MNVEGFDGAWPVGLTVATPESLVTCERLLCRQRKQRDAQQNSCNLEWPGSLRFSAGVPLYPTVQRSMTGINTCRSGASTKHGVVSATRPGT